VTDLLVAGPRPVVSWDATQDEWVFARTKGIGGSDIAAVLGFSGYSTPWEVWAEKSGVQHAEDFGSTVAQLGTDLEPWLLSMAPRLIGQPVARTSHRTYAHHDYPWRRYSPDGIVIDGRLFEAKTAGLMTAFGVPSGWADGAVPLGYEFQDRWGMHVMDAPAAEVIALVAGLGLVHRTITRDLSIEADLVDQVSDWHLTHVVGGVEPPMGAGDHAHLIARYPRSNGKDIDLPADALDAWAAYRAAHEREKAAAEEKAAAGSALKALLGVNERGLVDGKVIATWAPKKGQVDWPRLVAEWAAELGVPQPDAEAFRKPSTRTLSVKD